MSAPEAFAGQSDRYERLWTPHRIAYIKGEAKPADSSAAQCPFCSMRERSDEEALVVRRTELAFVVLNLFPYNTGHLLVCPWRHVADYTDLTDAERTEVAVLTQQAMRVTRAVSGPDGFNLGMNQGEVAGAGIAAHLHQHVVPRWRGDANFLPIIAQTKALPELLADTRARLAAAWDDVISGPAAQDDVGLHDVAAGRPASEAGAAPLPPAQPGEGR
ncbi:MAG: HIT domain-containing protein [Buchananella hordeovulneris]|nr:HIT domain-containing protein [Buchananella hordeovulneris]